MTAPVPAVEKPEVGAMEVLRRGLAISPELKTGFVFTAGMAVLTAMGQLTIPILIQQILDRGLEDDGVRTGFVVGASLVALGI